MFREYNMKNDCEEIEFFTSLDIRIQQNKMLWEPGHRLYCAIKTALTENGREVTGCLRIASIYQGD